MAESVSFVQTSLDEQETTINVDYSSRRASIYTSRAAVANNLLELCEQHPDETSVNTLNSFGLIVEVPLDWINIRPKFHRELTEEQRQALSKRLAAAREARKAGSA